MQNLMRKHLNISRSEICGRPLFKMYKFFKVFEKCLHFSGLKQNVLMLYQELNNRFLVSHIVESGERVLVRGPHERRAENDS